MPLGIDVKDVKPKSVGVFFLVRMGETGEGLDLYTARFLRVRVVMGQVNMADMADVHTLANQLQTDGLPYLAFPGGRDCPLPETGQDAKDMETLGLHLGPKH